MQLRDRIVQHRKAKPAVDWFAKIRPLLVSRKDLKEIDFQLPDFTGLLSLLLANGLPIAVAISWLASRSQGLLASELEKISRNLELGADLVAELEQLAIEMPNQQLVELCEKLTIAITRGAPIAGQLQAHASTGRAALQRQLLKQAGSNETKMLVPVIFLILPVTVLFAIFPSFLVLAKQF
jgi:tight adherence protein C